MRLCDGTWISWRPEWYDNECGECGQVTGKSDGAEPAYHGKRAWERSGDLICIRCKEVLPDIEKINHIAQEKLLPKIVESVSQQSTMLAHLRGNR